MRQGGAIIGDAQVARRSDLKAREDAGSMKANLLLILLCVVAIAACVALSQRSGDCAEAKNTWTGMLLVGCPE
jgi:hypothetical protein